MVQVGNRHSRDGDSLAGDSPDDSAANRSTDEGSVDWNVLIERARDARSRSYSPYSRFAVGAALLCDDGTVSTGCNVENRTFGLCVCAERVAVTGAVASGRRKFVALAVVTDTTPPAVPCGLCLETLSEFARDLAIVVADLDGARRPFRLRELHPHPFEWPDDLPVGD